MIDSMEPILACGNIDPFELHVISHNNKVRVFQWPSAYICAQVVLGFWMLNIHRLWIVNIHMLSINMRLTWMYCLGGFLPLIQECLQKAVSPCGHISPPLVQIREMSGFVRYLHSFWHIPREIRFGDNFMTSKCIWQSICNVLQI